MAILTPKQIRILQWRFSDERISAMSNDQAVKEIGLIIQEWKKIAKRYEHQKTTDDE